MDIKGNLSLTPDSDMYCFLVEKFQLLFSYLGKPVWFIGCREMTGNVLNQCESKTNKLTVNLDVLDSNQDFCFTNSVTI
jgi:hypothetical protein